MKQVAFLVIVASLVAGIQSKPTTSKYPTTNYSPVHDILAVLPTNKIEEIEQNHLKFDDGFKAAVLYFQGSDWTQLVNDVLRSKEYKKFAEMTGKFKLDISQAISCMKNHIDSLKVVPTKITSKPNLEPFITDVQDVLPIGEVAKALVNTANPEAKRIRQAIGTKENQKIAEDLHNLEEMVKMREVLKGMNFDVEPYIALLYTFLGWVH